MRLYAPKTPERGLKSLQLSVALMFWLTGETLIYLGLKFEETLNYVTSPDTEVSSRRFGSLQPLSPG